MSDAPTPPIDPRALALRAVHRWRKRGDVFMDRLVAERIGCLNEPRDRRLVAELCYGVVRHRNTLEAVARVYLRPRWDELHPAQQTSLLVGLYQIIYLRIPDHAAVNDTIEAHRAAFDSPHIPEAMFERDVKLLNAVFRRITREMQLLPIDKLAEDDRDAVRVDADRWARIPGLNLPERANNWSRHLGIKYSHPPEMVRIWRQRYDDETLVRIFLRNNKPPTNSLILRSDVDRDQWLRRVKIQEAEITETDDPRIFRANRAGSVERLPGFADGQFWVQDPTALSLVEQLPDRPDATLLDLCSAPGTKLIALLDRRKFSRVLACDVNESRLRLVAENLQRLRLSDAPVECVELPSDPTRLRLPTSFDQIIVDAPCSNTGVLNRRHDARWRFLPEVLRQLESTQRALVEAAARHLNPGGQLLYTTCSLEPGENTDIVHGLLRTHSELRLVQEVEILPGESDGDGGYGALLERR